MKLTKKQEDIKAKILAGTHVLKNDVELSKAKEILKSIEDYSWGGTFDFYGLYTDTSNECIYYLPDEHLKDRPIINMSEWFEESEVPSESTKDMREYDDKLLMDYNVFVLENDLEEYLPRARKEFVNKRYPNEALLKRKAEILAELKEIEEQLGSKG
jgi:hypothetical protein